MDTFRAEILPDEELDGESSGGLDLLHFFVDLLETVFLSLLLFLVINAISARIRVDGYSMEPTLLDGEYVLVNKLSYWLGEPKRGDIVVFHFPRQPEEEYIKRIIGLPSDHVLIRGGTVYVNNVPLSETYIKAPPNYVGDFTVPEDSLFVLGDNRNNSSDSHNWGWLPVENIVGEAVLVYWPPRSWGLLQQPASVLAAPEY